MKRFAIFIIINVLSAFLSTADEYYDTIVVNANLHEIKLNNNILDTIISLEIEPILDEVMPDLKKNLCASCHDYYKSKYGIRYYITPIMPDEPSPFRVENGHPTNLIGYIRHCDIYILLETSFTPYIEKVKETTHTFTFRLLYPVPPKEGKVTRVIYDPLFWEFYIRNDSIFKPYFNPALDSIHTRPYFKKTK